MFIEAVEHELDASFWQFGIFYIGEGVMPTGGDLAGKLVYQILVPIVPPEGALGIGRITCDLVQPGGDPDCEMTWPTFDTFRVPIGNFTDNRFSGETEDGMIVQGFRLQYD